MSRADKPLTLPEASARFSAACARLGGAMLTAAHAQNAAASAYALAEAREWGAFEVWCNVTDTNSEPSRERWTRSTLPLDEFLSRERSRISSERFGGLSDMEADT